MAKKKVGKQVEETPAVVEEEAEENDWHDYMTDSQRERYEEAKSEIEAEALARHVRHFEEYRDLQQELGQFLDRMKYLKKEIRAYVKETGEMTMIQGAHIEVRSGYTKTVPDKDRLMEDAEHNKELRQYFKQQTVAPGILIKIDGA